MREKRLLPLAIALLMFPQIAQTLYSPALAGFAEAFSVPPGTAAQAFTVYFLAFAIGVVGWGRLCDRIGRRPAVLAGLALYAIAAASALAMPTFDDLLITQAVAAFGAAVGSVVTQTILRDRFSGPDLAKVFSVAGMVLAASPAIGLFAGAGLVDLFGYRGVMLCLVGLSVVLLGWTAYALPETRPADCVRVSLRGTFAAMLRDPAIWCAGLMVAVFNIALFSYYALGPFVFRRLGCGMESYGYSGVVLALGAATGAWLNKWMLKERWGGERLLAISAALLLAGGAGVQALQRSIWFLMPMLFVVLAFGIAIPNVLGQALNRYSDRLGTAGALFGLMYYLLIGMGMWLAGHGQALGITLVACGALAVALCCMGQFRSYAMRPKRT